MTEPVPAVVNDTGGFETQLPQRVAMARTPLVVTHSTTASATRTTSDGLFGSAGAQLL